MAENYGHTDVGTASACPCARFSFWVSVQDHRHFPAGLSNGFLSKGV